MRGPLIRDNPRAKLLLRGSTMHLRLDGVQLDGAVLSDAECEATVTDAAGTPVAGQSWPITLAPLPGEPGSYRGTISHAAQLTAQYGKSHEEPLYRVKILISSGDARRRYICPAYAIDPCA